VPDASHFAVANTTHPSAFEYWRRGDWPRSSVKTESEGHVVVARSCTMRNHVDEIVRSMFTYQRSIRFTPNSAFSLHTSAPHVAIATLGI
jgi:hypothetical protein